MVPRRALIPVMCWLGVVAPLGAQASRGVIRGTIIDSIRGRPLVGARVSVIAFDAPDDSARTTTTDDLGAYMVTSLAPGTYAVRFASALLDSLEFGGPPRRATIANGENITVDLGIPSGHTLRGLACPGRVVGVEAVLGDLCQEVLVEIGQALPVGREALVAETLEEIPFVQPDRPLAVERGVTGSDGLERVHVHVEGDWALEADRVLLGLEPAIRVKARARQGRADQPQGLAEGPG